MMNEPVWLNGAILPRSEARLDPLAQGLLFGAGVYDTLLLRHGAPVQLEEHLARLAHGAARLGLTAPSAAVVLGALAKLTAARPLTEARLRITLAAGPSGVSDGDITLITLTPLTPAKPSAALTITPWRRNENSPLAGMKATACAENLLAQRAARAAGFDEALFLNTAGELCEAAFANIFLVRQGRVLTPPLTSGCLPGVMRKTVLTLCQAGGIPAAETVLTPEDALHADELFVTSSLRGLQPVHRLDAAVFSVPGPITQNLQLLQRA